jgi:hypothetical protein
MDESGWAYDAKISSVTLSGIWVVQTSVVVIEDKADR